MDNNFSSPQAVNPQAAVQPFSPGNGQLVMICPYGCRIMQNFDGSNHLIYPKGREDSVIEWFESLIQFMKVNQYQNKPLTDNEKCPHCVKGQINGTVCMHCRGSGVNGLFPAAAPTPVPPTQPSPNVAISAADTIPPAAPLPNVMPGQTQVSTTVVTEDDA